MMQSNGHYFIARGTEKDKHNEAVCCMDAWRDPTKWAKTPRMISIAEMKGWMSHDDHRYASCDQCKHQLICLVDMRAKVTFESRTEK